MLWSQVTASMVLPTPPVPLITASSRSDGVSDNQEPSVASSGSRLAKFRGGGGSWAGAGSVNSLPE